MVGSRGSSECVTEEPAGTNQQEGQKATEGKRVRARPGQGEGQTELGLQGVPGSCDGGLPPEL